MARRGLDKMCPRGTTRLVL
ncbi:uncharacterized protein G2W53_003103 [Senna tora]|uniref:Uncharacterized protein n=1 Tax=Senna tora TaxID=362788 RepID=A0A834X9Q0_9FABA|nr:uncharacterized protein G2W53_003103 [Senna tora]